MTELNNYNPARRYDVWDNPPELEGKYPKFQLKPPGTFNADFSGARPVPGYGGRYVITRKGNVYSVPRMVRAYGNTAKATGERQVGGRILSPKNIDGQWYVRLSRDNKTQTRSVKSLIAGVYGGKANGR